MRASTAVAILCLAAEVALSVALPFHAQNFAFVHYDPPAEAAKAATAAERSKLKGRGRREVERPYLDHVLPAELRPRYEPQAPASHLSGSSSNPAPQNILPAPHTEDPTLKHSFNLDNIPPSGPGRGRYTRTKKIQDSSNPTKKASSVPNQAKEQVLGRPRGRPKGSGKVQQSKNQQAIPVEGSTSKLPVTPHHADSFGLMHSSPADEALWRYNSPPALHPPGSESSSNLPGSGQGRNPPASHLRAPKTSLPPSLASHVLDRPLSPGSQVDLAPLNPISHQSSHVSYSNLPGSGRGRNPPASPPPVSKTSLPPSLAQHVLGRPLPGSQVDQAPLNPISHQSPHVSSSNLLGSGQGRNPPALRPPVSGSSLPPSLASKKLDRPLSSSLAQFNPISHSNPHVSSSNPLGSGQGRNPPALHPPVSESSLPPSLASKKLDRPLSPSLAQFNLISHPNPHVSYSNMPGSGQGMNPPASHLRVPESSLSPSLTSHMLDRPLSPGLAPFNPISHQNPPGPSSNPPESSSNPAAKKERKKDRQRYSHQNPPGPSSNPPESSSNPAAKKERKEDRQRYFGQYPGLQEGPTGPDRLEYFKQFGLGRRRGAP